MITRWLVVRLGVAQLICWGISYHLIAVFGEPISRDLGWSMTLVFGGFSVALVVMGLTSGLVGRMIDRHGGKRVMTAGSLLLVAGCFALALTQGPILYAFAWVCLGAGMRMTLYEAAFASLVRIGGQAARRGISQITLYGGLASTAFFPIGHMLGSAFGWRGALVAYGLIGLATLPLHWTIPDGRSDGKPTPGTKPAAPLAQSGGDRRMAIALYVTAMTIGAFLNSGMAAHMIVIIAGLGAGAGLAVWLSTLRGVGQTSARLAEVLFGARLSPLTLGVIAAGLLPLGFFFGLYSGALVAAGAAFAFVYGASNGLLAIVRGTQPLVLFDPRTYGALMGRLTAPGFIVSALAPVAYARLIEVAGYEAALHLSLGLGLIAFACCLLLWWRFRPGRGTTAQGAT